MSPDIGGNFSPLPLPNSTPSGTDKRHNSLLDSTLSAVSAGVVDVTTSTARLQRRSFQEDQEDEYDDDDVDGPIMDLHAAAVSLVGGTGYHTHTHFSPTQMTTCRSRICRVWPIDWWRRWWNGQYIIIIIIIFSSSGGNSNHKVPTLLLLLQLPSRCSVAPRGCC